MRSRNVTSFPARCTARYPWHWSNSTGLLAALLLLAACAPTAAPQQQQGAAVEAQTAPAQKKQLVAIIAGNPRTLSTQVNGGTGGAADANVIEDFITAGLTKLDDLGTLRPQLAEAVPSIANGLWRLLPDGKMETTWKIREGARWHDGTPFTSGDLAFTYAVARDSEMPLFRNRTLDLVESIDTPDPRTVTVTWTSLFIEADTLFTHIRVLPLPRHILEAPYTADKAGVVSLSYWTDEFVGSGPFRLREFAPDSHVILTAQDGYVLGRPKLDEVEIRFVTDHNAVVANVLSGAALMTMGRGVSLDQAVQLRDQWQDGKLSIALSGWLVIFPQLINPTPTPIADVRFRRALLHAIDRKEMVDTLMWGTVPIADSLLLPTDEKYREIAPRLAKYDFDPRRAAQTIEEFGYARSGGGAYRDSVGRPLSVEMRTTPGFDIHTTGLESIASYWRRAGVEVESTVLSLQQSRDLEFRSTAPGFTLQLQGTDTSALVRFHSREIPLPENRFTGDNKARYSNAELDALLDKYIVTIPSPERTQALGQVLGHLSEAVIPLPLFYNATPTLVSNRVQGATTSRLNVFEWDVR
ncbi:MAG: hypothetical protein HW416_1883 [Chloroflexi bacterium]|nr:hypothetical protein [Chloroflexota bacterium]